MLSRLAAAALALSFATGCAFTGSQSPEPTSETKDGLTIQFDGDRAKGTFEADGVKFAFASERLHDTTWDVTTTFGAMTMTFSFDQTEGVIEMDGWANANGGETQMMKADREAVIKLRDRLSEFGEEVPEGLKMLRRVLDHWTEWPETVSLQRIKLFDQARTVTSICGSCGTYKQFTHDCQNCATGADGCTAYGYVKQVASQSGCAEGTKWKTTSGGTLVCLSAEPGHSTSYEYGYGNCFARCGAGCASEKDYTNDCGNHDLCVRFGHADASAYCDDEFTSCSDDEISAPTCSSC